MPFHEAGYGMSAHDTTAKPLLPCGDAANFFAAALEEGTYFVKSSPLPLPKEITFPPTRSAAAFSPRFGRAAERRSVFFTAIVCRVPSCVGEIAVDESDRPSSAQRTESIQSDTAAAKIIFLTMCFIYFNYSVGRFFKERLFTTACPLPAFCSIIARTVSGKPKSVIKPPASR